MLSQQSSTVQGFTFTELLPGLVICEAVRDIHHWRNGTEVDSAFLVYLGYNIPQERDVWISRLRLIWSIDTYITYRASQRVNGVNRTYSNLIN
jgi:hypothetical protein